MKRKDSEICLNKTYNRRNPVKGFAYGRIQTILVYRALHCDADRVIITESVIHSHMKCWCFRFVEDQQKYRSKLRYTSIG